MADRVGRDGMAIKLLLAEELELWKDDLRRDKMLEKRERSSSTLPENEAVAHCRGQGKTS